ncbi:MAG: hypothetical protein RLZ12_661, partial [Bacillota bacterium]
SYDATVPYLIAISNQLTKLIENKKISLPLLLESISHLCNNIKLALIRCIEHHEQFSEFMLCN